jgi:hypothetical protein
MVASPGLQTTYLDLRRWALGLGPAALLALIGLWEACTLARADRDTGADADWARAAAAVRERHRPGELIVFAPGWIDPVGRRQLGDLIPIEMAARMDDARFGVVWELSVRGARAPEARGQVGYRARFGAVQVRRVQRDPARVVTDFVAAADAARYQGGAGRVGLEEVGFEPHRCISIVPPPGGTVSARFDGVELGAELVGYVGLADVFTRRDVRAPGRLRVSVDGAPIAEVTAGVDDGWVRFRAATTPGTASVVFAATAVGEDARDRRICFAAEARR